MIKNLFCFLICIWQCLHVPAQFPETDFQLSVENPFFSDKKWGGAADPVMVWNEHYKEWFVYYTQRRAYYDGQGVEWMHGSSIGIASSKDGKEWKYRGTCVGDENLTNTYADLVGTGSYCTGWLNAYVCYFCSRGIPGLECKAVYQTFYE